eukprot:m.172189 g.172189  ORF g.172189 m.172189 type:complete len:641 (+) comp25204_c0_seq16:88-2010(+)
MRRTLFRITKGRLRALAMRAGSRWLDGMSAKAAKEVFSHWEPQRTVSSVRRPDGSLTSSPVEGAAVAREFYSTLFGRNKTNPPELDWFSEGLCAEARESLNAPFTTEEAHDALMSLRSGGSPGLRGVGAEFFKLISDLAVPHFLLMLDEWSDAGEIPLWASTGLLSVLSKGADFDNRLDKCRPITVLPFEYKWLSQMILRRMEPFLADLVDPCQAAFVKGRRIQTNILNLIAAIHSGSAGADFSKAYDRLDHKYLLQLLDRLGFGDFLCTWVAMLYAQPLSCVKMAGVVSPTFAREAGVAQGDPLSPALFILAIQPLFNKLRSSLQGVQVAGGTTPLVVQGYADDSQIFCGSQDDIDSYVTIMHRFCGFSGLEINFSKSFVTTFTDQYRCLQNRRLALDGRLWICPYTVLAPDAHYRVLGISLNARLNWSESVRCATAALKSGVGLLRRLSSSDLSVFEVANLAGMFALSRVTFNMHIVPWPDKKLAEAQRVLRDQLWRGLPSSPLSPSLPQKWVAASIIQLPWAEGGLNFPMIRAKYFSLKGLLLTWALEDTSHPWAAWALSLLPPAPVFASPISAASASTRSLPETLKPIPRAWAQIRAGMVGGNDFNTFSRVSPLWGGCHASDILNSRWSFDSGSRI